MSRLRQQYQKEIIPQLKKKLELDNDFAVPKVKKVVVNIGITEDQHQDKALENMADQLRVITGQQPKVTRARKSIAGFGLRAGDPIGLMVTLRGHRMYHFLDKLMNIVLPQVRDFQGVSTTAFDQNGNYSLGFDEQIVFPEIDYDKIDQVRGLQVNIVTTAKDKEDATALLKALGMPFKKIDS